ncbi:hypothetical protein ISF_04077 [Cordyceps fumosorosea ARSEF 2679]|uniref:Ilp is an apoptosis inhibitor n=1 Tax=Cordyceps fumosorosea (strain ARSEF 2679) TaxID=1081104 RepID=A0A167YEL9_CORFA|nr:hypothetical protein ISF_04077 [Cordyceps fumosorosea ARSEF 2679]OAA66239.1 hypothetical protein ISF_04077 [Cordyceps fumosorosea ARSEF 2679]
MPFQHPFQESQFDLFDWYPKFRECQSYFIQHAQYTGPVQTVAAKVNILLPFQKAQRRLGAGAPPDGPPNSPLTDPATAAEPLVPYVRRLVATGFDTPAVMFEFFGDEWTDGVGPVHQAERRNFLFAAKSENWATVKASYDMDAGQLAPFLRPLQGATEREIRAAEHSWSEWLAMQDWMIGPRAPPADTGAGGEAK